MFILNLKIAFRSLWKNRVYASISIAGLAVAFAVFILAMLYVSYERGYDSWNKSYRHIFRVNYKDHGENVALSPGNMATTSREKIPAVTAATRIQEYWNGEILLKTAAKSIYANKVLLADSNFLKVFEYPLLYGNSLLALNNPQALILSKEMSERIFGKGFNPVGESLLIDNSSTGIITAVIDEAKYPSHFRFNVIKRFRKSESQDFYSNNYYTYIRLNERADLVQTAHLLNVNRKELLGAELTKLDLAEQPAFADYIHNTRLYLQPVSEIHLTAKTVQYEFANNGLGKYIYLMIVLASLVLIISAVNFTNLSVTLASGRAKETGIRKVLGAYQLQITWQFLFEISLQCALSLVLAVTLAELLLPAFNTLTGEEIHIIHLREYGRLLGLLAAVLLAVICIAGLYPAVLISRIVPAIVLKGNFSNSQKGQWIRNGLIVLQFSIAVLFISGVCVVNKQLDYMESKDLGYKPAQVIALNMMQTTTDDHYRNIKNKLGHIPGVNSISRADHIPGEDLGGNSYMVSGKAYGANFITVDVDYFRTMGMRVLEGRSFDASNTGDSLNSVLLTEAAARSFGIPHPVGRTVDLHGTPSKIIGMVKDFHHYSPERKLDPIVFQYMLGNRPHYVLVSISSDHPEKILNEIEHEWQKLEPGFPIRYKLLDKNFRDMLQKQAQLKKITGTLSGLTIGLALTGVFAIAAFNTQRRRKEMNIRKVLGASMADILALLNAEFVRMVILANILALPLAFVILTNWLRDFAFRIALPVSPFVLSAVISLTLTILIVSLQSYRSAKASPAETLRHQ